MDLNEKAHKEDECGDAKVQTDFFKQLFGEIYP